MSQMHFSPRYWFASLAAVACASHVMAGSVSLDPSQPAVAASAAATTPRSDTTPADRANGAGDIDLGEAGKLVRLVDGAEQPSATRVSAAKLAGLAAAADARAAMLQQGEQTGSAPAAGTPVSIRSDSFNGSDSGAARPVREGGDTYVDPAAGRGVLDQATPEQRGAIRELVAKVRAVLESPLAWIGIAVLAIATLAISAAGRRHK